MGQGTGKMLKRGWERGRLFSFTHSNLAAQPAPWARGSLGSIKGPSVSKEGTEMGSRSGEPGISPKHSQMRKMAEREGSDMPDLGKQNCESTDSTSTSVVERECAEIPLWPAEGERAGAEAAPLHSRATRGSLTSPMCP